MQGSIKGREAAEVRQRSRSNDAIVSDNEPRSIKDTEHQDDLARAVQSNVLGLRACCTGITSVLHIDHCNCVSHCVISDRSCSDFPR